MSEIISKSAKKRRFKHEESAAEELALLSDKELKNLPAEDDVKEEIKHCRGLKGGARKRQIKYLAKIMRAGSVDDVLDFLEDRKGSHLKATKLHKEAERLRDVIVNEAIEEQQLTLQAGQIWEPDWEGNELDAALKRYKLEEGDLRKAVFQYVKTRFQNHYREVFRILKAAVEKEEMLRKIA